MSNLTAALADSSRWFNFNANYFHQVMAPICKLKKDVIVEMNELAQMVDPRSSRQSGQHRQYILKDLQWKLSQISQNERNAAEMNAQIMSAIERQKSHQYAFTPPVVDSRTETADSRDHVVIDMGDQMQISDNSTQSAAIYSELRKVQSNVQQIAGLMNHFAVQVSQQGESVWRIDHNINDTYLNMEEGGDQLVQYANESASNNKFTLKAFLVTLVFIPVIVFFL